MCAPELLKRRIVDLEAENTYLRESSLAFGELAERLNQRMPSEAAKREGRAGSGDPPWERGSKS